MALRHGVRSIHRLLPAASLSRPRLGHARCSLTYSAACSLPVQSEVPVARLRPVGCRWLSSLPTGQPQAPEPEAEDADPEPQSTRLKPEHPGHDSAAPQSTMPDPPPIHPYFVEVFRGMGQVVFCNSSLSGVFIAGALMLGDPQTGVMALLGCSSATLLARSVGLERGFVSDGLAGYNGALVGCALSVFQPALPLMPAALGALGPFSSGALGDLLLTLLVGGLSAPVAAKLGPLMAPVPQWTVVFNVLALTVLSGCAAIKYLSSPQSPSKPRKPKQPKQRDLIRLIKEHPSHFIGDLIEAMMVSVSQIFVVNSPLTGLLITVGIFCYSPAAAGLTLGGAMLGNLSALISGIDYDQVMEGLWGYNAALSSLAVGIFFVPRGLPYAGLVAAGAVGSTMVTVAVKQLMDLADLPCMTVPFCLMASACFLLGGRVPGLVHAKAPHSPEVNLHAYRAF
ncbi:Urea transporter 2 (Solute carrier family 14 member 2) (Urea transporter [Durusdinium trenchii]|uniref:Kidney n=1 Tax=Durusdinium trenchii TaxID=1381693 RepID=A0ABP0HW91_9DINO